MRYMELIPNQAAYVSKIYPPLGWLVGTPALWWNFFFQGWTFRGENIYTWTNKNGSADEKTWETKERDSART